MTEEGRRAIAEDLKRTELLGEALADLADASVSLIGDQASGETGLFQNIENKQNLFDATRLFVQNPDNRPYLSALQDSGASPEQKQAAYNAFVQHIAQEMGVPPTVSTTIQNVRFSPV